MSKISEEIKCYVCNSDKIKFHSDSSGFVIAKCRDCGLLWTINVNENDISSFYNKDYFNNKSKMGYRDYLADEENHRKNARRILRITGGVKELTNLKILDVGCAFGFLLDEARRFNVRDACGVEISPHAREYASGELNLTNVNDDPELCNLGSDFFDVVFLIGTIEHLVSPKKTLCNIGRVLKQGGLLVITTIDTKGLIPLYSIKPPEHIFYFNHNNIVLFLNASGFKSIKSQTHFVTYYLHDLFYRVGEYSSLPFLCKASTIIKKILNISVNIPTNEMLVIAEKL